MPNYCIVNSFEKKQGRYPSNQELDDMGLNILKFKDKCKICSKYISQTVENLCIYRK